VPKGADADFTVDRLVSRANDELANGFGNLVSRVVSIWQVADEANRYVNRTRPWALAKAGDHAALAAVLRTLLSACQAVAALLAPFLPDAAARITVQCTPNESGFLPAPSPLLPRLPLPATAAADRGGRSPRVRASCRLP